MKRYFSNSRHFFIHLCSSLLDPFRERWNLVLGDIDFGFASGENGDDRNAGMSTDDGAFHVHWIQTFDFGDERVCAHDIESGDAEESPRVVHIVLEGLQR